MSDPRGDFLVTFLASILQEQEVPDPMGVARRVAHELRKVADPYAVIRAQILADRSTDWRDLRRRYQVCRSFIYKVWGERGKAA